MIKLRCQHDGCALYWATIQNGVFMVHSNHHHGEKHLNVLQLSELQRLIEEDKRRRHEPERVGR